jgi:hypothetical protein
MISCFRIEWGVETRTKVNFSIGIFRFKYSLCGTQDHARISLIMMSNITGLSMETHYSTLKNIIWCFEVAPTPYSRSYNEWPRFQSRI